MNYWFIYAARSRHVARSTLDHLREQIRRRLKQKGLTQRQLAEAVGHSGPWLSMILRGRRGIQIPEIDAIAAYLEATPSALFDDPDYDPRLNEGSGKAAQHGTSSPTRFPTPRTDGRLIEQLREIITRQQQALDRQQHAIEHVLGHCLHPAIEFLGETVHQVSAAPGDRLEPVRRRGDRSKRPRSATPGRR